MPDRPSGVGSCPSPGDVQRLRQGERPRVQRLADDRRPRPPDRDEPAEHQQIARLEMPPEATTGATVRAHT